MAEEITVRDLVEALCSDLDEWPDAMREELEKGHWSCVENGIALLLSACTELLFNIHAQEHERQMRARDN